VLPDVLLEVLLEIFQKVNEIFQKVNEIFQKVNEILQKIVDFFHGQLIGGEIAQ